MATPTKVDFNALRAELANSKPVKGSSVSVTPKKSAREDGGADFQSPTKKRRQEPSKMVIDLKKVLKSAHRERFEEWMVVHIIDLQEDFVKDPRVRNYRRRIVLADDTATCVGFIKTDKLTNQLQSGDTVEMSKFKYNRREKALVIHSGTFIGK